MEIEENLEKLEKKVEKQSLAMELLEYSKEQNGQLEKTNKRLIAVLIIVLIMWFATICYLVFILNDIEKTTDTIDVQDVESIDNSHIKIGDDIWEKSE